VTTGPREPLVYQKIFDTGANRRQTHFPVRRAPYNVVRKVLLITNLTGETFDMAIKLTERAAQEVKKIMVEQKLGDDKVLRVGVKGGGCSGFQYALGFDDTVDEKHDKSFDCHGVMVAIDRKSELYLDGVTVDFFDGGLEKRGFVFENPNAVKSCGCGSSFQA
jgi:iron-sulfur cluster assembly protein